MDEKTISVVLRDINGKRTEQTFRGVNGFQQYDWSHHADDEILLVVWGEHCVYSALADSSIDGISIDELTGFFA